MRKNRFYFREFLNLPGHHSGAHILAQVEDTTDEKDIYEPEVTLDIADCSRKISLDFSMYSHTERHNSLRKAHLLADVLARFAEALEAEAVFAGDRERHRRDEEPDKDHDPKVPTNELA